MCIRCVSKSRRLFGVGRTGLGAGSAAIALLVPKCPLCLAAWAWGLSALGIGFDRWDQIKWPLTAAFWLLAALLFGLNARPWVKALVLCGSGVCLFYKVWQDSTSFWLAFAIGFVMSATVAIAYLGFARARMAKLGLPHAPFFRLRLSPWPSDSRPLDPE